MDETLKIYIDDRERNIAQLFIHGVPVSTRRMNVGDYAVSVDGVIVAVIERKTLADFAASLKDGRYANVSKMRELRDKFGVAQVFFVEGKPPKDPSSNVPGGRIPYRVIEAAMDHLAVRDNITTIITKDTNDFAHRLSRFAKNMATLYRGGDVRGAADEDVFGLTPKLTDDDITLGIWCAFKGIGAINATPIGRTYTVADVVRGRVPQEYLDGLSKKVRSSLTSITHHTQVTLLESVPGVNRAIANDLLRERNLATILSYSVGALSICKVGKSKRNLGEALASKIIKYFNHKLSAPRVATMEVPTAEAPTPMAPSQEDAAKVVEYLSSLGLTI